MSTWDIRRCNFSNLHDIGKTITRMEKDGGARLQSGRRDPVPFEAPKPLEAPGERMDWMYEGGQVELTSREEDELMNKEATVLPR